MNYLNKNNDVFNDIIGQEFAISFLSSVLNKNRISNAYIFSGPEGIGKKLTALRFLEGILNKGQYSPKDRRRLELFQHPDLLWIEPTYQNQGELISKSKAQEIGLNRRTRPQIRLEQIRDIAKFLSKIPLEAVSGMVVIEGVETMAEQAANALLKTLEEPKNGLLILITSRTEKLLPTIHSRCQSINFSSLNKINFQKVVGRIYEQQKDSLTIPDLNIEEEISMMSNGSPGAFIENIQSWSSIPNELWPNLKNLPKDPLSALSLAKEISDNLDIEQQSWLINWLQQNIWGKERNVKRIKRLEKLRFQLGCFVQPRLAWEIALLEIRHH